MTLGKLYAIGVGPGDPQLLTIKAANILQRIKYVFTAASDSNGKSLALQIASQHLAPDAKIHPLYFPMTRNKERLEKAWEENCTKIKHVLQLPEDAAFITLGDPSTYSTFTYLMRKLNKSVDLHCEIVPGITSYQASAALVRLPLAEGEESFTIVSGAKGTKELEHALTYSDNIVIIKAYKHYKEIVTFLKEKGLAEHSVAVRRCGLPGEEISFQIDEWDGEKKSYFTLLIVKKRPLHKKLFYK